MPSYSVGLGPVLHLPLYLAALPQPRLLCRFYRRSGHRYDDGHRSLLVVLRLDRLLAGDRPDVHRCYLTVIGYDINDSVVVFDRIRENLRLHPKGDKQKIFNDSINETLARTINTSFSTLIVLLAIFILGGDSIRSFSFAMIVGVFVGTLSSIFLASPIAYMVLGKKIEKVNDDNAAVAAEPVKA
jgi:multisubunit Na+/H+ antiporter MnhG subunit